MQIGIDSFAAAISDPATGLTLSPVDRMQHLLEEIELADQVGLDVFGIGEHHRAEFLDSAPAVILAAAAARTKDIRLTSAVTVLSAADPVRVFQEFATLDLISHGRAEIVAGRGSFVESYPLFGLRLEDYDELFAEKLDLLLAIRPMEWQDVMMHFWKIIVVAGPMYTLNPSNINFNVTAQERRSHSGKPIRRISSSKRGSERRGSNPERSRMLGLNRSSYALSSQCMAWSLSPMDA